MSGAVEEAIVRRELLMSLVFVGVGWSVSTVAWTPDWLVVGATVTAVAFLLGAAADRSEAGLWALIGTGVTAMVALVVSMVTNSVPADLLGPSILGMAVGFGLNRFLFGVVNPVPEVRCRRESAD
ncbi:hypothetical protein [Haloarchaeobius sp. FL176]|uniref:hypothetical protein n=1 Tax=Haloarchaeobius sp. FL176 TaxID=2967129 RepID=UPI002147AC41|nr:hypothetical protein [Haloarchaeobius sp. FL176]